MTDKETLREAVARAICKAQWPTFPECRIDEMFDAYIPEADAAIATMFERLRTPSDGMIEAGESVFDAAAYAGLVSQTEVWQAMLTAFQQENSDAD